MNTYSKLRDGTWAVRVAGDRPAAGDVVTITKRSGETKVETIASVLSTDGAAHLCAIVARTRPGRSAYQRGDRSEGARRSHYDRSGFYAVDGTYLGKAGPRCVDAPCCGCCT